MRTYSERGASQARPPNFRGHAPCDVTFEHRRSRARKWSTGCQGWGRGLSRSIKFWANFQIDERSMVSWLLSSSPTILFPDCSAGGTLESGYAPSRQPELDKRGKCLAHERMRHAQLLNASPRKIGARGNADNDRQHNTEGGRGLQPAGTVAASRYRPLLGARCARANFFAFLEAKI